MQGPLFTLLSLSSADSFVKPGSQNGRAESLTRGRCTRNSKRPDLWYASVIGTAFPNFYLISNRSRRAFKPTGPLHWHWFVAATLFLWPLKIRKKPF